MPVKRISRRTLLRGLGVAISLPWLEGMGPLTAWAEKVAPKTVAPNRMAFLYVPNGVNMADWTPKEEGAGYKLPPILEPLTAVKDKLLVLTGLTADKARAYGDGGGDHARALAAFLTGAHPYKTDGTSIRNGISVDQAAAARIGDKTRLASLEIGCEHGAMAGNCDSGYSCVYSSTMSWRSATQPLPKEVNPKIVFERLFASAPDAGKARRDARRKSILDYVREDSKGLSRELSKNDVRKLDEYFTTIRDIELRIERAEKLPPIKAPDYPAPTSIPASYEEHLRLMCDLIVLAFQADVTRISTFVLANEASNKPYPFIQVPEGHHDLSHHGGDAAKQAKLRLINIFHSKQLAYLLGKLDQIQEGDGTLLDHSMIAYGSGIHDGNAHNHEDLPILLAGGGCGTLSSGRHIRYGKETPINNLWLSMLNRVEVTVEKLGDSTGTLPNLFDPNHKPVAKTVSTPVFPKPIMCKQGELLLEESFDNGKYGKPWFRITGKFEVSGGQLKCAEIPADNHHSELSTGPTGPLKAQDFVIQFAFKLDGAKMLAIGFENPKGHVARAIAKPDSFEIMKWDGKQDSRKIKLDTGTWHRVLVEVQGSEMVAQVDDQPPLYFQDESLKVEKPRLVLINYGQFAWFDEIKIWKAEPSADWPAKRAKLKR
ncbi:MAG TPA: DUF1552 domain-containing protein [Gemmataceae bacterium]